MGGDWVGWAVQMAELGGREPSGAYVPAWGPRGAVRR